MSVRSCSVMGILYMMGIFSGLAEFLVCRGEFRLLSSFVGYAHPCTKLTGLVLNLKLYESNAPCTWCRVCWCCCAMIPCCQLMTTNTKDVEHEEALLQPGHDRP